MSNSYDWEENLRKIHIKSKRKSTKKFIPWTFGKRSCFTKSSKQYRSSHFWILWKTLSLDYRAEDKIITINLRTYTAYYILTKFEKLLKQNFAK